MPRSPVGYNWQATKTMGILDGQKYVQKHINYIYLTHALELLLQLGLVLAVGDTKVVIGVRALLDAERGGRRPDGHDRGRSLGPRRLPDFLDGHHVCRKEFSGGRIVFVRE